MGITKKENQKYTLIIKGVGDPTKHLTKHIYEIKANNVYGSSSVSSKDIMTSEVHDSVENSAHKQTIVEHLTPDHPKKENKGQKNDTNHLFEKPTEDPELENNVINILQ